MIDAIQALRAYANGDGHSSSAMDREGLIAVIEAVAGRPLPETVAASIRDSSYSATPPRARRLVRWMDEALAERTRAGVTPRDHTAITALRRYAAGGTATSGTEDDAAYGAMCAIVGVERYTHLISPPYYDASHARRAINVFDSIVGAMMNPAAEHEAITKLRQWVGGGARTASSTDRIAYDAMCAVVGTNTTIPAAPYITEHDAATALRQYDNLRRRATQPVSELDALIAGIQGVDYDTSLVQDYKLVGLLMVNWTTNTACWQTTQLKTAQAHLGAGHGLSRSTVIDIIQEYIDVRDRDTIKERQRTELTTRKQALTAQIAELEGKQRNLDQQLRGL